MFGGMGGMGGRNSNLRFLRLGALAALLIGTSPRSPYDAAGVRGRAVVLMVVGWGAVWGAVHSGRRFGHRPDTPRTLIPNRTRSEPYSVR
jgi:hypothetical protein